MIVKIYPFIPTNSSSHITTNLSCGNNNLPVLVFPKPLVKLTHKKKSLNLSRHFSTVRRRRIHTTNFLYCDEVGYSDNLKCNARKRNHTILFLFSEHYSILLSAIILFVHEK